MRIKIFETLKQKIFYIEDINIYFDVTELDFIGVGDYIWSKQELIDFINVYKKDLNAIALNYSTLLANMQENNMEFESIKGIGFTLCLHPSRKCNLKCKYCFRDSNFLGDTKLSFKMARDAIDFFVFKYAKNASKYLIDLSGSGEPLLEFGLIKKIVSHCDNIQNKIGKSVSVMFATNAVNLSEEKINYIDNNLTIGFSLDGNKLINDENRCLQNGEGTYELVINSLKCLKNRKVGLATTITPKHQEVDIIYNHLVNLPNIDCISMKFIRCFDDSELDFSKFNISYLISRYEKLCENILRNFEFGNFDYIKPLLCGNDMFGTFIKRCLHHNYINAYPCDASINRISIDSLGDIYACSVLMGEKNSCIGNIFDGIDKDKQLKYLVTSNNKSMVCQNCWVRYICGGECYAVSFLKFKEFYHPYSQICLLKKELIKLSMGFISKLMKEYPEHLKKILDYQFEVRSYEDSDTGYWAINQFLQHKGYRVLYSDIAENVIRTIHGIDIEAMLEYINRYDDSIKAYTINSKVWPHNLNYPLISWVNKIQNSIYVYIVILREDDDYLYTKSMFNYKPSKVLKSDFLENMSNIIIL